MQSDPYKEKAPWRWLSLPLLACAVLSSCGGPDRPDVHSVRGQVLVKGQPAAYALVIFHPQGGSEEVQKLRPVGRTASDGYFTLTSYGDGDGAPAASYKVTVVWPGENPNDPSNPSDPEGRIPRGPDRLQGRYSDPATTSLSATVVSGENRLEPFALP